jgi:hypothetical protein
MLTKHKAQTNRFAIQDFDTKDQDREIEVQLSDSDVDKLLRGQKVDLATFTFLGYPIRIRASIRRLRVLMSC